MVERNRVKNHSFWSCITVFGSPEFPKGAIIIDSSGYSNWIFSVTTGLIFSIEVSMQSFTVVEQDPVEKSFCFDLFACPKKPNNFVKVDSTRYSNSSSYVTTGLISSTKFPIESFTSLDTELIEKFCALILPRNSYSPKLQNVLLKLIDTEIHNPSSRTYRFIPYIKVPFENFLLLEGLSFKTLSVPFFASEAWWSKIVRIFLISTYLGFLIHFSL